MGIVGQENIAGAWYDIMGVLVMIIGTLSIIGNGAILVLYGKIFKRRKSRVMNLNLISLTLSDIGMCITFTFMIDACFNKGWRLGPTICDISAYTDAIFAYSQIYILTMIAIERFMATRKPKVSRPQLRVIVPKILFVWTLAILLASCPYMGFGGFMLYGMDVSCTFDYIDNSSRNVAYVIMIVFLGFLLPVMTICVCYACIYRIATASSSQFDQGSANEKQKQAMRQRELRLAKTAAKAIVCFVIAWAPYATIACCSVTGHSVPALLQSFCALFAKTSTALNAVVYVVSHPEFSKFRQGRSDETTIYSANSRVSSAAAGDKNRVSIKQPSQGETPAQNTTKM